MNKMIKSLYVSMIQDLTPTDRISRAMKEEILDLLKEEEVHLNRQGI